MSEGSPERRLVRDHGAEHHRGPQFTATDLSSRNGVQELLHDSETFESVFAEFDEQPLGAASVAQVHRAVLTPKYGGGEVAVKVQRPAIESKLMGDVVGALMS